MAGTGPVAYATASELMGSASAYLRDPNNAVNNQIATTLLNAASRFIDEKCGRFFYNDGSYRRFFDGQPNRSVTLSMDFFSVTALQLAYYENQPLNAWLTLFGDGVTAGNSNFYLWPANPKPYVSTGQPAVAPWQGFDLPLIPVSNTAYLPTPRPGRATIAMTSNWGWPLVPDLIKDLTLKMASRAWESRQAGWASLSGDVGVGTVDMSHHFDSRDEELLTASGFVRWMF